MPQFRTNKKQDGGDLGGCNPDWAGRAGRQASMQAVLHNLAWMRGLGVDLRVASAAVVGL